MKTDSVALVKIYLLWSIEKNQGRAGQMPAGSVQWGI
jgi:hypothetical protein